MDERFSCYTISVHWSRGHSALRTVVRLNNTILSNYAEILALNTRQVYCVLTVEECMYWNYIIALVSSSLHWQHSWWLIPWMKRLFDFTIFRNHTVFSRSLQMSWVWEGVMVNVIHIFILTARNWMDWDIILMFRNLFIF